jgi:hypothetical protein
MRYLILIAAVLVGIAAYTVFWFHVKAEVQVNIAGWMEDRRDAGDTVRYDSLDIAGYPFRIEVTATNPRFGRVQDGGSWTIDGHSLRVIAAPWNLGHIVAYQEGPFEIRYHAPRPDGPDRVIELTGMSDAAGASAVWKNRTWDHADLEFSGLSLTAKGSTVPLTVGHLEFHVRLLHPDEPAQPGGLVQPERTEYALEAMDLAFPGATEEPFGRTIQDLSTVLEVHGDKPLGRTVAEIEAWRDAGGTVDVNSLALDWGPLQVQINGSLALDENNRPMGALTAKFTNYDKLIDALSATKPGERPELKRFLEGLMKSTGQPQDTLTLPFSMQDGALYLGPVAVTTLPPLIGPSAQPAPSPATK